MTAGRFAAPLNVADEAHAPSAAPAITIPTAITIVSYSQLLRDGLATLLGAELPIELIGSYAKALPPEPPNPPAHVVLLDGSVGRAAAVSWTRFWRGLTPPAHVIILELNSDVDTILACVAAGAGGYTLQGATAADVADAIRDVLHGRARCSPEVTAQLFARLAAQTESELPPRVPLTPRELDVLRCVAEDLSNQEIADRLVIDVRTVKHHVHNILDKLDLQHRWDAARLARERGWLA